MKYLQWFAIFAGVEIFVILPLWTWLCYSAQARHKKARSKQWLVVYGGGKTR